MTQCPVGSIRRKENLEIIIEDWCIGCGKCAELCPYGNINMHPLEVIKEVKTEIKSEKEGAPPGIDTEQVKRAVARHMPHLIPAVTGKRRK